VLTRLPACDISLKENRFQNKESEMKSLRCFTIWLLFLVSIPFFGVTSTTYGEGYKGFQLLNPDKCVPLDKKALLQLSAEWQKYGDFVKICGLSQKKGQTAKVSIISVWADEFYEAQSPNPVWEPFPKPIIVDQASREIGRLPEVYPSDPPRWLSVYYGKWKSAIPTELRLDVENPAVEGNYYYGPLVWIENRERYEMKGKEVKYGIRRK
jgi:hypothetical protein